MAEARHPKQYPTEPALQKTFVSPRWKAAVKRKLEDNRRAGRSPSTASELAKMVGAHKTGLLKMLDTDQPTYRYAPKICDVLGVEPAVIANPDLPEVSPDEVERVAERLRKLPEDKLRHALTMLESFMSALDER